VGLGEGVGCWRTSGRPPRSAEERRGRYTGIVEDLGTWISSCTKEEECNFLWMEAAASAAGPPTVPLPSAAPPPMVRVTVAAPLAATSPVMARLGEAQARGENSSNRNSNSTSGNNGSNSNRVTTGNGPSGGLTSQGGEDRSGSETGSAPGDGVTDGRGRRGAHRGLGEGGDAALEEGADRLTSFDFLRPPSPTARGPPRGRGRKPRGEGEMGGGVRPRAAGGVPGDASGAHLGLRRRKGAQVPAQASGAGGEEDWGTGGREEKGGGGRRGTEGEGKGEGQGGRTRLAEEGQFWTTQTTTQGSETRGPTGSGPNGGPGLALGDATGAELARPGPVVLRWVGRGAPGVRRLARAAGPPPPREDWQALFLVLVPRGRGLGTCWLLTCSLLADLTRWVGCRIDRTPTRGGGSRAKLRLAGRCVADHRHRPRRTAGLEVHTGG